MLTGRIAKLPQGDAVSSSTSPRTDSGGPGRTTALETGGFGAISMDRGWNRSCVVIKTGCRNITHIIPDDETAQRKLGGQLQSTSGVHTFQAGRVFVLGSSVYTNIPCCRIYPRHSLTGALTNESFSDQEGERHTTKFE